MRRANMLVAGLAILIAACDDPSALSDAADPWGFGTAGPALNVVPAVPAFCGVPTAVTLIADEVVPVGTVEVLNDEANLYVVYRTSPAWPIAKTAIFVGDSPSDMPLSNGGNPRVGQFPYKARHRNGPTEVVWEIPLGDVSTSTAVIAAYAEVGAEEGAWADGSMISPGGSWATYFTHEVINCAAETIGPTGGTLTTPDGNVTFIIPSGALTSEVDITIEPATAQEILDHIANRSAPRSPTALPGGRTDVIRNSPTVGGPAFGSQALSLAANSQPYATGVSASSTLPTIEGLIPVEGTLYDFGPDGLDFHVPATVTIKYDPSKVPAGKLAQNMGVFVINGVIPFLPAPTTVDVILNEVTATIDHFSYAFAGFYELEADLTIARLAESADPIELGQAVTYTAQLGNLGPDDITDGVAYYYGFGDISAGPLSPGCTEISAPPVATVGIVCDVGAVASRSAVDAPPVSFVPNRTGASFAVWADPGSAEAHDPDNTNDRATDSYSVVAPVADVRIQTIGDNPDPADAGVPVAYEVQIVAESNQPVVGATLTWTFPNATFVSADNPDCSETAPFADLVCPLPDLQDGLFHGVQVTLQPDPGVTTLAVSAAVQLPLGTTDPDLANNVASESTTIGSAGTADLSIIDVIESADPIELGQTVSYQATIRNFGPDAITDASVTYTMFGNVVVGPLQPACTALPPSFGSVAVSCVVGAMSGDDVSFAAAATFIPQEAGDFTVWIDPYSSAADPNSGNNRFETTVTVTAPEADLSIQALSDLADPVAAGQPITYEIQLLSNAAQDVEGAQLFLRTTEATFVSATDPGCFGTALGVTCDLPTLLDGLFFGVQITVQPDAGLSELSVIAEVEVPFGTTDPDQNNDLAFETTTIEVGGPLPITVGQIIEGTLPAGGLSDAYTFDGVAGQEVRLHLSLIAGSTGTAQLRLLAPGGGEIYPAGVGGRASDASSANTVETLPFTGEYTIAVESSGSGPYRVGLGTAAGRLDLGYGPGGTGVVTGPRSSSPRHPFRQMAVLGNDVVTVGEEHLFKFDSNGDPVAGFGTNGSVELPTTVGSGRWGAALRVQPDGMIVVAGYSSLAPSPWWIARFDANGVLDPTFGTNGIVEVQFANSFNSTPLGIRFQQNGPDLDIVVAGYTADPPNPIGMVRLNPDGSLDTGFGTAGIMVDNAFLQRPDYMDMLSDGRILVGENTQLVRYTADGARDATFGVGGYLNYGINGQAFGLTVLPGDGLLVLGAELDNAFVLRLTSSGAADGSFGTNGLALYDFGNRNRFQAATIDASGNYIVVGHQRTPGNDYEWLVTRLSSAGALDPVFGIGGYTLEHRVDDARAVRFDSSGRLIVGGQRNGTTFGVEVTRHIMN